MSTKRCRSALQGLDCRRANADFGVNGCAGHDQKICDHACGEESVSPRTRTQPLVRRPDCLRHSGLPQGCRRRPPRRSRESVDFTPKVIHAERVQTVNAGRAGMCFRLFQYFGAPDHVVNVDASQSDRNRPLRLGQRWPYDVVDQRGIRERERLGVLGGRRCA